MLDLLQKRNNSEYITHRELQDIIEKLKHLSKGEKGEDAYVSEEIIDAIIREVTPSSDYLKSIIKPLIPEPTHGKDGRDGRDGLHGNVITTEEIIGKVKGNLLVDHVKGMKKYISRINELSDGYSEISEAHDEYKHQLGLLEKRVHSIVHDVVPSGRSSGTPSAPNTCSFVDPSSAGTEGEHWLNQTTNELFIYMCGQWFSMGTVTPYSPPEPEAFLMEDGEMFLTEDGDALVIE
jgi:hypothetical protein